MADTTVPSMRRTREAVHAIGEGSRIPLNAAKLRRKESKGGLRGIFTRHKAEKRTVSPILEEPIPAPALSERPVNAVSGTPLSKVPVGVPEIPRATPRTPAKPKTKPSRINLASRLAKKQETSLKSPNPLATPKSSTTTPTRASAIIDPIPYFQAIPQSIKHAQLAASTLSADSILRISSQKRPPSVREGSSQSTTTNARPAAATKKTEKARSKHRRQISGSISKADWTQKIFVLVTSGYLLQYSGDGSFDRLPEKMLQLGKDSVAFATDVIPGKYFVLQISQKIEADGTPTADSRSLLSRLTFRSVDYRRTATSFLLVLESAEEMDSWLAVMRREIEALGGKKHVSETGKPNTDNQIMELDAQPSHRYIVKKDTANFWNQSPRHSPTFGDPPWDVANTGSETTLRDAASLLSRPVSSLRPSTGRQSVSNSVLSQDDQHLDSLRDNSNRLSFMSSGQRTLLASECTTPTASPTCESMTTPDDYSLHVAADDAFPRPAERRGSTQAFQNSLLDAQPMYQSFRPHSTYIGPSRLAKSHSPVTPNFSVPISSSKRYSTPRSRVLPPLEIPALPPSSRNQMQSSMQKGARKSPPPKLNVVTRKDSASRSRQPLVFTPTETSFKMVPKLRASVIDIPSRSPNSASPNTPRRLSSPIPVKPPDETQNSSLPRHYSSVQAVEVTDSNLKKPIHRLAPMPPAALSQPLPDSPLIHASLQPEKASTAIGQEPRTPKKVRPYHRPMSLDIQRPQLYTPTAIQHHNTSPPNPRLQPSRPYNQPPTSLSRNLSLKETPRSSLKHSLSTSSQRSNRKSIPILLNGPPLAPPPECALPPLPPASHGMKPSMNHRASIRA